MLGITLSRIVILMLSICFSISFPINVFSQENDDAKPKKTGLQQRIDFGSSYILGQSIKSGAIYLMHRKQSDIKGMLEVRQDYRNEIMEDHGLEKTAIIKEAAVQNKSE